MQARFFCANLLLTCVRRHWQRWPPTVQAQVDAALRCAA